MAAPKDVWSVSGYSYRGGDTVQSDVSQTSDIGEPTEIAEDPGFGVSLTHWGYGLSVGEESKKPYKSSSREQYLKSGPPMGMMPGKYSRTGIWGRRSEFEKDVNLALQSGQKLPDWYVQTLPYVRVGTTVYTPAQFLQAQEEGTISTSPYSGLSVRKKAGPSAWEPKYLSVSSRRSAGREQQRQEDWERRWELTRAIRESDYPALRSIASRSPGLVSRLKNIDARAIGTDVRPLAQHYAALAETLGEYARKYPDQQDYQERYADAKMRAEEARKIQRESRTLRIHYRGKLSDAEYAARLNELRDRLATLQSGGDIVTPTYSPLPRAQLATSPRLRYSIPSAVSPRLGSWGGSYG